MTGCPAWAHRPRAQALCKSVPAAEIGEAG